MLEKETALLSTVVPWMDREGMREDNQNVGQPQRPSEAMSLTLRL